MGLPEKIKAIEDEIHRTQINKHTEYHIGLLKAKLAKLRKELETQSRGGRGGGLHFEIRKSGDASVVLIGLPSVGKSTLLNTLTNAKSKVADYAFTTLNVVPGLLEYRSTRIQILDLPGIISGASKGRGRGRQVLSVARNANLVLLILDVFQPNQLDVLKRELDEIGIRLDKRPPQVKITQSTQGGIAVTATCRLTKLNESMVKAVLNTYDIQNAKVVIREDISVDELIDTLDGNRKYIPSLTVLNKIDLVSPEFLKQVRKQIPTEFISISAERQLNIDRLKETIYQKLNLIRIYLRRRDGETDFEEPLIIPAGSTIEDICNKIHRQLKEEFKWALVSGSSAKFKNQKVGLTHPVTDEDIVTIIK